MKLAECKSRIRGATALGLYDVCSFHIPEWVPHLAKHGIFQAVAGADVGSSDAEAEVAEAVEGGQNRPGSSLASGQPQHQVKCEMVSDDQMDRLRLVNVKNETAGAEESTAVVPAMAGSTPEGAPKRRKMHNEGGCHCQCSGQCGSKACDGRRNLNQRAKSDDTCPIAPQLGCIYCHQCKCEVHQCAKPRYRGRWCKIHKLHFDDDGNHKCFSSPYAAKVSFPDGWLVELRLVAKYNYIIPSMIPADFTVLLGWIPEQLSHSFLVAAFLAQSLKWPPAVRVFYDAVRKVVEPAMAGTQEAHGSTNSGDTAMARELAMAYRSAILALNGASFKDMFDRMNTGLMHAQTGLAVQGTEFGLVSKQTAPRLGEAVLVLLGPRQTEYYLCAQESEGMDCATEIVHKMLGASREAGLRWPTGHDSAGIVNFCNNVFALTKHFRLIRYKTFGFRGGVDDGGNMYKVRSFCRVVLAMLQIINPECFCELTYGQLIKYCPDQRDLSTPLDGMMVPAVERLLNVNPLLISCWACLFGGVRDPADERGIRMKQLLGASSSRALRVVEKDWLLEMAKPIAESRFPVGPRGLADALLESPPPRARAKARPAVVKASI